MGLRAIATFAAASLAVAAACSTFEEAPDDGRTDAGPDAPAQDDGSPLPDAGSDGWLPCKQRPVDPAHFCDDFDREGAVTFGWNGLVDAPDAAVGELFSTGGAYGTSFRGRVPAGNPPGRAQLLLKRPPPAKKYRLELDVRVDSIPHVAGTSSGFSHLAVVQFDDAPCLTGTNSQRSLELSLYATDERVTLLSKGLGACPDSGANIPPMNDGFAKTPTQLVDGKFHHVSIAIEKTSCPGTQSTLSVYSAIDDLRPSCRPIDIDVLTTSKEILTYVGPYIGSASYADTAFVYDNVTIDFE